MADLPKELFGIGHILEKREYHFIGINGEESYVFLNFGDRLTDKRCILDGAYIVVYSGDPHTVSKCPACEKSILDNKGSAKNYINSSFIPDINFNISRLKGELNHLETLLKLAENPDNGVRKANLENSQYNKANLSAKSQETK